MTLRTSELLLIYDAVLFLSATLVFILPLRPRRPTGLSSPHAGGVRPDADVGEREHP